MTYVSTGDRFYSNDSRTYTRCQERVKDYPKDPLIVGGFALAGLDVYLGIAIDSPGVGARRLL